MEAKDFFGTLQDAITVEWRKHLQTKNHDVHVILDEFYKEMPEKVDALIEAWQADNDNIEGYSNQIEVGDMTALEYLQALKKFTKQGRAELLQGETELESLCDDVLALIDSTIYKLKKLTNESFVGLTDFIRESLQS